MLSRRHIRIKVLQTLYGFQQNEDKNLPKAEKQLLANILNLYESYLKTLLLLKEISEYTDLHADNQDSKFLSTKQGIKENRKFANNFLVQALDENDKFQGLIKTYKAQVVWNPELIKGLFNDLKQSEEYKTYCETETRSLEQDVAMLTYLLKQIVMKTEDVAFAFDEFTLHWDSDQDLVFAGVNRTIKTLLTGQLTFQEISSDWKGDWNFALELFRNAVLNDEKLRELIDKKTKNWELERIAQMDVLILGLAATEMLNFSEIPVKVTINEYIEIAKNYSTPKSKTFVNGILDSIFKDFKEQKLLHKSGKGLIE